MSRAALTLQPEPSEALAAEARLHAAGFLTTDPTLASVVRSRGPRAKDAGTVFLERHGAAIAKAARASLNGKHARGSGVADADLLQGAAEEALRALRRYDMRRGGSVLGYVVACVRGMQSGLRSAVRREVGQRRGQRELEAAASAPLAYRTPRASSPRELREAAREAARSFVFGSLARELAALLADETEDPGAFQRGWRELVRLHGPHALRAAEALARDRVNAVLAA